MQIFMFWLLFFLFLIDVILLFLLIFVFMFIIWLVCASYFPMQNFEKGVCIAAIPPGDSDEHADIRPAHRREVVPFDPTAHSPREPLLFGREYPACRVGTSYKQIVQIYGRRVGGKQDLYRHGTRQTNGFSMHQCNLRLGANTRG